VRLSRGLADFLCPDVVVGLRRFSDWREVLGNLPTNAEAIASVFFLNNPVVGFPD
jgi:hypothetical protein